MLSFSQKIGKIGVNPYVSPPENILRKLFRMARKEKGPIPVRGTIDGAVFKQTLVKYAGKWRLYINGPMLRNSGLKLGDTAHISIKFDPSSREVLMHPALGKVLAKNLRAKSEFAKLAPHRRKEILRYLHNMKTKESLERNIGIVIGHLSGKRLKGLHALLRVPKRL